MLRYLAQKHLESLFAYTTSKKNFIYVLFLLSIMKKFVILKHKWLIRNHSFSYVEISFKSKSIYYAQKPDDILK